MSDVCREYPTLYIHAINTDQDHVHIQVEIPPNVTIAAVVQKLKIESSKRLKKKFKFIREMYLNGSIWSVGYYVSTIGLNEDAIRRYIGWQGKRDMPKTLRIGFS